MNYAIVLSAARNVIKRQPYINGGFMKIELQHAGNDARLIITSGLFSWKNHNALVGEILMCLPRLRVEDSGFLFRTTIITGLLIHIMYAQTLLETAGYDVVEEG